MSFFHVDLDAFYASVEQQDNPELRGKPVIVGARPGSRGVVAACSYEARKFGVRSAMPITQAVRLCPQGIFLPVRRERYLEASQKVMDTFSTFTPSWIPISIDEASLDMTGTEALFGSCEEAAVRLKNKIREITGLSISIGIACNRYLAKLASEYKKPDGLFCIHPGEEIPFIDALGVAKLWGIGPKTLIRLKELQWDNPARIRELPLQILQANMGVSLGEFLFNIVRGIDPGIYGETAKSHSISQETTFPEDLSDPEFLATVFLELSHQVIYRLHQENGRSHTILLKVRYPDFTTRTLRRSLAYPIFSAEELFHMGWNLFQEIHPQGTEVRLIGIGLDNIEPDNGPIQQELFPSEYEKQRSVEKVIYELQKKNPAIAPKKASILARNRKKTL
jgi:DNA polymerase-4